MTPSRPPCGGDAWKPTGNLMSPWDVKTCSNCGALSREEVDRHGLPVGWRVFGKCAGHYGQAHLDAAEIPS